MSGEDEFIRRHFAPLAGPGAFDLRDDAAAIRASPGCDIVLTTDAVVAGVHFLPDDPPGDVARKALRVNLSDLAAKGASPLGFLLTLALPRECDDAYVSAFATALGEDSRRFACPLLGGDTVSTPGSLTISITAVGQVLEGRMVPRGGAQDGDHLYVTGTIGDAALGLLVCTGDPRLTALAPAHRTFLADRYRKPQPRTALAAALRDHASAGMDVSDGLVGDLAKMLTLAGLSARIDVADISMSEAVKEAIALAPELFQVALTGGDDYELLCAVPETEAQAFALSARSAGIPICCLGKAQAGDGVTIEKNGRALRFDRLSFSHV